MTDGWGEDGWPLDTVEPFPPCKKCGSVNFWQDFRGEWRCCVCERDAGNRAMSNAARMLAAKEAAAKMPKRQRKPPKAKPDAEESHQDIIERAKRENRTQGN